MKRLPILAAAVAALCASSAGAGVKLDIVAQYNEGSGAFFGLVNTSNYILDDVELLAVAGPYAGETLDLGSDPAHHEIAYGFSNDSGAFDTEYDDDYNLFESTYAIRVTVGKQAFTSKPFSPSVNATGGYVDFLGLGADVFIPAQTVSSVVIRPDSAVPEPASWALLLAGFGGLGAALRRRDPGPTSRPPVWRSEGRRPRSERPSPPIATRQP